MNLVPRNEICISNMNWEKASKLIEILVTEGFSVMVTVEERLIVINYEYAGSDSDLSSPDRNLMVFMRRDEFEEKFFEME